MSRAVSAENQAALEQRLLVARDFLSIWPRDRETGAEVFCGFWSDLGPIAADVIDPETGTASTRTFIGSGKDLIAIGDIPAVAALQVQTVPVRMSQLSDPVAEAIRFYEPRQARVEIHRGLFNPGGRTMVAAAECRFFGFIDTLQIETPIEGEDGGVNVTLVSHTREITRANPDTRSHESQILRTAGDDFLKDAVTVKDWDFSWGKHNGKVDTQDGGGGNSGGNPVKFQNSAQSPYVKK